MPNVAHNVKYAARVFARAPAFAGVAVLTLAVAVGANTAIFSVANALLLRPLPYAHHALVSAVRERVHSIDADQPVTAVQTMEELLESGAAQPRCWR